MYLKILNIGLLVCIQVYLIESISNIIRKDYSKYCNKYYLNLCIISELILLILITTLSLKFYLNNSGIKSYRINYIILIIEFFVLIYWLIKNIKTKIIKNILL